MAQRQDVTTVIAIVEPDLTYLENRCHNIPRSAGIKDPLYGCQWHLKNNDQFRNSGGHDIRVEEVWPTYKGSGINVAVVDAGMHFQHEDLTDNVLTSFNHNYHPDLTDIYHPLANHGTAVAGLIAAKDNSLGMRGVAPKASIYGYNVLVVRPSAANKVDAMSRNAATTAIFQQQLGPWRRRPAATCQCTVGRRQSKMESRPGMAEKAFSTRGLPAMAMEDSSTTTPLWTSYRTSMPSLPSALSATTT